MDVPAFAIYAWIVCVFVTLGLLMWFRDRKSAQGAIPSSAKRELFNAWYGAVGWWGMAVFLPFVAWGESQKASFSALLGVGVSVVLLASALGKTRDWVRYGPRTLHLNPLPAKIGSDVSGWLDMPVRCSKDGRVRVTLQCQLGEECDGDDGSRTFWNDVWSETRDAVLTECPYGTRISFQFRTPLGLPASDGVSAERHKWHLVLSSQGHGAQFSEFYEIPVRAAVG